MEYSSEEILDLYRPFELQQEALSDLEDHFEKFGSRISGRFKSFIPLGIATAFFAWLFSAAEYDPMYSVYFLALILLFPFLVLAIRIMQFLVLKFKYRSKFAKTIHTWRQEVGEYAWTVAVLKGPFIDRTSLRVNTGYAGHALGIAATSLGFGPLAPLYIAGGLLALKLASYVADGAYAASTKSARESELDAKTMEYCIKALESLVSYAEKLDTEKNKDFKNKVHTDLTKYAINEVTTTANILESRKEG